MEYIPSEGDLDLLTDELREGVESGELVMLDPSTWYSPTKPVVKSLTGKLVKGSGKIAGSKDAAVASRETAYKRTKAYNEALEELIPVERGDSKNAIASLRELVDSFMQAAKGNAIVVECPDCGLNFEVQGAKPDPHAIMKMIERLTGRAKETQEVNIRNEHLYAILNERAPIRNIDVITIDPQEEARRRQIIELEGEN